MNENELTQFMEEYISYWQKIQIFFLLKTALSLVIETVLLLDRLLYLHEKVRTTLKDKTFIKRKYCLIMTI